MSEVTAVTSPPQLNDESFKAEVVSRFGLLPNFFQTAKDAPGLIQELWSFARSGYLDNPLPSVFKERLFVHLSRFCEVRYCIVRHVGFLIGQGNPAGDPAAIPHTIEQAVRLLNQPAMLPAEELDEVYARLNLTRFTQMPAMETREEKDIFAAASVMFVQPGCSQQAAKAVRTAIGGTNFEILTAFLAFIRTAHYWTLTHQELTFEADMAAMLVAHEHLAKLLLDVSDAAHAQLPTQLHRELLLLRQEHDDRQLLREALAG
ncbi:hypothetical protein SFA35_25740 (plasmid) [Pseudomonas sp. HR96]|uniref:hypothetical protein n=1 Tax=Pseudomonas sp. HR96 TaxID=1027966 RepID=UPI002A75F1E3|nr:hypothetical protein [Pseudomonas sp. HR96]WPP02397.1 hypothetical protein SFA35_25740 [Pseudomonas sp. HR96]